MTPLQWTYALACEVATRHGDVIRLGEQTLVREGRVFWLINATGWVVLGFTETTIVSMCGPDAFWCIADRIQERLEAA